MDESVELTVSQQLRVIGLDVVSVHSLGLLGQTDWFHLQNAHHQQRALCTYDADFLRLAHSGIEHSGIIYASQRKMSIGIWVREVQKIHQQYTHEALVNQVMFIGSR